MGNGTGGPGARDLWWGHGSFCTASEFYNNLLLYFKKKKRLAWQQTQLEIDAILNNLSEKLGFKSIKPQTWSYFSTHGISNFTYILSSSNVIFKAIFCLVLCF